MKNIRKTLLLFSKFIILITILCLYSFCIRHVTLEGKNLGLFTNPLKYFASFPKTFVNVLKSKELRGIPPTYVKRDENFEQINILTRDIFGINSFFNRETNEWDIKLFNFRDDSVIHVWKLKRNNYIKGNREFSNSEPKNCILLENREIIIASDETNNLYKLDRNSNIIWHNTKKLFHHAYNLSNDGNIWICSSAPRNFVVKNKRNLTYSYRDDYITKVNIESGKVVYDKSVTDILVENGYKNFVFGFCNTLDNKPITNQTDPLHLNDIQPAYDDSEYWNKGDLFLSLRHKSLIIHYRPSTNQIIRFIYGPFLNQHDIDIISDHEISVFNNNTTEIGILDLQDNYGSPIIHSSNNIFTKSNIVIYDFRTSSFRIHLDTALAKENIYTITQGFHEVLSDNSIYIESQNESKLFILDNNGKILLKKQLATELENMVHMPHWIRIYEKINF